MTHLLLLLLFLLYAASFAISAGGQLLVFADRAEPARRDVHLLATIARDAAVRALLALASPFERWTASPRPPSRRAVRGRPPVLLVGDVGAPSAGMVALARSLEARGVPVAWVAPLSPDGTALAERAEHLVAHLNLLQQATGAPKIDVVAHGIGGLAVATALRHLDAASRIRRVITLGTPWHGTRGRLFVPEPLRSEILPGAHQLDHLAEPPVPVTAIWSPDDPTVLPGSSASPTTAVAVRIEGLAHWDMLASAMAFRAVHAALEAPPTGPLE